MTGPGVVVGFDGSACSTRALDWAADEAAMRKVPLTLCHAWELPVPARRADPTVAGPLRLAARCTLARGVALAAQRSPGLTIVPRLLAGPAAPALVQASEGAELLMAGTRGNGGWQWPGLGSVSTQLAARAQCPLLVVPDDGIWRDGPIIVGVDGSLSSQDAAGFAVEEASLRHALVIAVCCWSEPCFPDGAGLAGPPDPGAMWRRAEERFKLATWPWRRKYPEVAVIASFRPGRPARTLRDAAVQASLLVVGARGLGGLPGLLLGPVTHELLQNAACPIAVVR